MNKIGVFTRARPIHLANLNNHSLVSSRKSYIDQLLRTVCKLGEIMKKIFSTNSSLPILTNTDSEDFQPRATNIPIPIVGLALVFKAGEHILQIDGDLFPKSMRKLWQIDGERERTPKMKTISKIKTTQNLKITFNRRGPQK